MSQSDQELHKLIQSRARYLIDLIQVDDEAIFEPLSHLKEETPFNFDSHLKWVEATPISHTLDHTLLKPEATQVQFDKLCDEAVENDILYVCVPGSRLQKAKSRLEGTPVKVACVMGFPHGNGHTKAKVQEASLLLGMGATELDMVLDVGRLKDANYHGIRKDIHLVAQECRHRGKDRILKVILETCLLSQEEIIDACIMAVYAGADFVKTSTGFSTGGATAETVRLMKLTVGNSALVKASGGVRTYEDALKMLKNGASRIGTSNGVAIVAASKQQNQQ